MMKLLLKTAENPHLTLESKNATIQTNATITAYAIQTNGTLSPLFVLQIVRPRAEMKSYVFLTKANSELSQHCRDRTAASALKCLSAEWRLLEVSASTSKRLNNMMETCCVEFIAKIVLPIRIVSNLHRMKLTLATSYVGQFQVTAACKYEDPQPLSKLTIT